MMTEYYLYVVQYLYSPNPTLIIMLTSLSPCKVNYYCIG